MALSRKFLQTLGIESDKIDEIVKANSDSLEAVKEERDKYKEDAEKLPKVQKELDDLKKATQGENGKNPFEEKYNTLKTEYDNFKESIEKQQTHDAKAAAYRQMLKDAKVSEKRIDSVLKVSDVDAIELDKDGKIKDADKLKESIAKDWADFIEKDVTKGADTSQHPESKSGETDPFLAGFDEG